MTRICTSVEHTGKQIPEAKVAVIYHDPMTNGGLPTGIDPKTVEPGEYGTNTSYLCLACAASHEVIGSSQAAFIIRTIAL